MLLLLWFASPRVEDWQLKWSLEKYRGPAVAWDKEVGG
jgi:hypothetical protein